MGSISIVLLELRTKLKTPLKSPLVEGGTFEASMEKLDESMLHIDGCRKQPEGPRSSILDPSSPILIEQ